MTMSKIARWFPLALVGVCTGLVHGEDVDSQRSDVLRVLEAKAPTLVTRDGEMVADWQIQRGVEAPIAILERIPTDRAEMEGDVLDAITFRDDVSRYDVIFDQDGAVVLDRRAQTVSDSFAFSVGPVPAVRDPERVVVATLGAMARRNGDSGVFDMEVGDLTSATAMDALDRSDAVAVYLDAGAVVTLFFHDGILDSVFRFAPTHGEGGENRDGTKPEQAKKNAAVCDVLSKKCTEDEDVDACGHWLDHCLEV